MQQLAEMGYQPFFQGFVHREKPDMVDAELKLPVLCFFGALADEVSPPLAGVSAAIDADAKPKANTAAVIKVPDLVMRSPKRVV